MYPIFGVETFHGHIMKIMACEDKSTTTLHHCDIIAMVVIVPSNVVAGVATADNNCFISVDVLLGLDELRGME